MVTRLKKNGDVKKQIGVNVTKDVYLKVRDVAAKKKVPMSEWICSLIDYELEKIEQFG